MVENCQEIIKDFRMSTKYRLRISHLSLFLLVALINILSADSGFRRYAGEFMAIDVSARAQALGGAYTAVANDVYATFYNPAGLASIQSTQLGITHTQQFIA
ncbi:MAG: hypothetical protein D6732_09575, partial [Methanobacteriota archaeon]